MGALTDVAYTALAQETKERWDAEQPDRYQDLADSSWYDLLEAYASAGEPFAWLASKKAFLEQVSVESNSSGYIVRSLDFAAETVAMDVCQLDPVDLRSLADSYLGGDFPELAATARNAAVVYDDLAWDERDEDERGVAVGRPLYVAAHAVARDLISRCLTTVDDAEEEAYNAKPDDWDETWLPQRADHLARHYEDFDRDAFLAACRRVF